MTDPIVDDSHYTDFIYSLIWGDDLIDSFESSDYQEEAKPQRVIGDVIDDTDERFAHETWWHMDEPVGYSTTNGAVICDNQIISPDSTDYDSDYDSG